MRWNASPDGCRFWVVRGSGQPWLSVVAAFVCAASVTACGTTHAPTPKPAEPPLAQQVQTAGFLDAAGNPEPAVYAYAGDVGSIKWSMCAPGAAGRCTALATVRGIADPGPRPTGTVFKLTSTEGRQTYTTSLRWHGRLQLVRPPEVSGTPRVGATVRVSAGHWTGGWGTEREDLGIEACRTSHARGCVMLAGAALTCSHAGCGELGGVVGSKGTSNSARVGLWYAGWYLFALDARFGNPTSLIIGYASAAAIKPWPSNATIARSRPYGPVAGPPRPRVVILPRARVHGIHIVVAIVHCAVSCRAATSVQTRHANRQNRIEWMTDERVNGTKPIGVSGTLPAGRASVTIQIGNGPYVRGHSLIRR